MSMLLLISILLALAAAALALAVAVVVVLRPRALRSVQLLAANPPRSEQRRRPRRGSRRDYSALL